ncbi:hypothetical protein FA15DRAFT_666421 [Coprinopsis marcescibilis]|uniref:Uncharacterized protein n=1 Tax=Coprinopsis marcescibilis TaxID=230819 RepID=A0A5C3LFS9_COPMA|nr:hypothetical protein FA15DRAFT_666421 [Coprinopsis marcescibilis]
MRSGHGHETVLSFSFCDYFGSGSFAPFTLFLVASCVSLVSLMLERQRQGWVSALSYGTGIVWVGC